jgi:site-specific DNA recombinase
MTTKAAIYLRVSTDEQVTGYGLDVQLTKCEALATVKGWVPSCVFSDEGISGTKGAAARPGLAAHAGGGRRGRSDGRHRLRPRPPGAVDPASAGIRRSAG